MRAEDTRGPIWRAYTQVMRHQHPEDFWKDRNGREMFFNRPFIHQHSFTINGGAYVTKFNQSLYEVIIVDDKGENPELYNRIYADLRARIDKPTPMSQYPTRLHKVFALVGETVRAYIPYDSVATARILETYKNFREPGEIYAPIPLEAYFKMDEKDERGGECRQQSLLAAYLIERLVKDNILPEKTGVSVERAKRDRRGNIEAHQWVRVYIGKSQFIVDATDTLAETIDQIANYDTSIYRKPEPDQQK